MITDDVIKTQNDSIKKKLLKGGDSEVSLSSNEEFEIINKQIWRSKGLVNDEKSNDGFGQLIKNAVKRRRSTSTVACNVLEKSTDYSLLNKKDTIDELKTYRDRSAERNDKKERHRINADNKEKYSSAIWKYLLIYTALVIALCSIVYIQTRNFDQSETFHGESLDETIARQQRLIEKLENELKNCARLDFYSLPVRIDEIRATAFKKKNGFTYHFIIIDWKKNDHGVAQQHLHLAFKQSNDSTFIYDHGPVSGKYFAVGDRIIDVDGIKFKKPVDIRDHIMWSYQNKDHFTCIIERPNTKQAMDAVAALLQPAMSSFSVLLST